MARLRYFTAGESHGEKLIGILEGIPAGLRLIASEDIDPMLRDRQVGYGRGRRQQIESDKARIVSGVRFGMTLGSPIAIELENKDWKNWNDRMAIGQSEKPGEPVTIPRPGHADYAGGVKYAHTDDLRNVFERASARETTMRVALGAIARKLLSELGIKVYSQVIRIGSVASAGFEDSELNIQYQSAATSPVRTAVKASESQMRKAIDDVREAGDTLGGSVECVVTGVPVGVGSHVHWDRKLDGLIAQAVMSIQAVKAVEIGSGVKAGSLRGSKNHDAFAVNQGQISRTSNNAGGIEGGMSNGESIRVTATMKPISTLMTPLGSVDLATGEVAEAHIERSDVCAVPALSVIVEAVMSLTVADALLDTFGGDTLAELQERVNARREAAKL